MAIPQNQMVQEGGANFRNQMYGSPYQPVNTQNTGASDQARALQAQNQGGTYTPPATTGAGSWNIQPWNPSTGNSLASANIYAGKAQAQGFDEARQAADASYNQVRADLAAHEGQIGQILNPAIQAGQTATGQLAGYQHSQYNPTVGYEGPQGPNPYQNTAGQWGGFSQADLQNDPGFQYRMLEAQKAIERSAAAGSGAMSGATLTALQEQSQNMASAEFQQARNRALEDYRTRHQVGMQDHQMRLADSQNQQAIHQANFDRQAQDYDLRNKKGLVEAGIQQFLATQGGKSGEALSEAKQKFAALNSANSLQNLQASMQTIMGKYDSYANAALGAEQAIYNKWEAEQNIQLSREQTQTQANIAKRGQDRSLIGAGLGAGAIVLAAIKST